MKIKYLIFLLLFSCTSTSIHYVNELPGIPSCRDRHACIKNFDIYVLEEHKNDRGLIEHERVHIQQKRKDPLNHARRYERDQDYRLQCEIEAYREQIKWYPKNEKENLKVRFAWYLSEWYDLRITQDEAYELLWNK